MNPSWLMPLRRSIAPVSRRAFTARSMGTSPQTTSRILLPGAPEELPNGPAQKRSRHLPLWGILAKTKAGSVIARDPCNIVGFAKERSRHTRRRGRGLRGKSVILRPPRESDVEAVYSWDHDPELAAWNGRSPISISLSAARRDYLARWEDPSVKTFIIGGRGTPSPSAWHPLRLPQREAASSA